MKDFLLILLMSSIGILIAFLIIWFEDRKLKKEIEEYNKRLESLRPRSYK